MFTIRTARREDAPEILSLIREIAEYEHLAHEVVATEPLIDAAVFGPRPCVEVLIAESDGKVAAFALFFQNFSTFLGRPGIFLEDIFVRPQFRRRGIGRALFRRVAAIAVERNCGRLEWAVLDWNKPALDFYRSLGAVAMSDWTTHRLTGPALQRLAAEP